MITREALRVLENNLVFTKRVRRDFDDNFGRAGAKIGTICENCEVNTILGRLSWEKRSGELVGSPQKR